tara:strand:- start:134 stop:583 length:450 start_codon:yes stop_codon:yes gene_type:complete
MKILMSDSFLNSNKVIILFDGECLMCNSFIKFIDNNLKIKVLAYSNANLFLGENLTIKKVLKSKRIKEDETIIVISDKFIYTHSSAIEFLLLFCNSFYLKIIALIIRIFNKLFLSDLIYKIVSKYRRSFWFNKSNNYCSTSYKKIIVKN